MSKTLTKKTTEKMTEKKRKPAKKSRSQDDCGSSRSRMGSRTGDDECVHCSKSLSSGAKALFVEEEVGRVYCSEDCITSYFGPEIERLEREYYRCLSRDDFSGEERESHSHLRWMTLENPAEVWREKTLAGDYRYTLIAEFRPQGEPVWCVCICLFLRGEPSFLYLSFPTRSEIMVDHYRRGERLSRLSVGSSAKQGHQEQASPVDAERPLIDGLADSWTKDEQFRAELTGMRRSDDIPSSQFDHYQDCMEETLEQPDEVWIKTLEESEAARLGGEETRFFQFIRHYDNGKEPAFWYVILARDTEDDSQIELLDAFPTRDSELVERYRQGHQEVGAQEPMASVSRWVH